MDFNIDHPIVTLVIIIGALIGVPFLLRSRFPKRVSTDEDDAPDTTGTPAPPPPKVVMLPAKTDRFVAPPAKRKGWYWPDLIPIALFIVLIGSAELFATKVLWPLLSSAATGHQANRTSTLPHTPSGAPVLVCTEPGEQEPATVTKSEVTRIDVASGCTLHLDDITAPEDIFERSCWDRNDTYHEAWDEACREAQAVGYKLKDSQPEDSRKVPFSFIQPV